MDSNFDLDDDTGQNNGNFFSGDNCVDNDDEGTTPMPTTTASTKRSGTAESCHKVSANPRSTTLTTTTMLSRTAKTLTTTTMDAGR